ncbi:MAG TPA: hypothetical protein VMR99_02745 [Candidatus Paceibacterota bacterium]|nr:hypothetical protein [Candidatus Paceibacterota bacterium]
MKTALSTFFVTTAFYLLILGGAIHLYRVNEANLAEAADHQFDQEILDAEKKTSDPCAIYPLELVRPPAHSTREAALVIGGRGVWAEKGNDLMVAAADPIPGEHAVSVYYSPPEPAFEEIAWLAYGTKACEAGLGEQVKDYAVSEGRLGNMLNRHGKIDHRPAWPTPPTKVKFY